MNKFTINSMTTSLLVAISICCFAANLVAFEKITAEEVIAKHIEAVGTAEARLAFKSASIVGTSKATFFGRGGGIAEGISFLASESDNFMVAMKFNNSDYQFEKFALADESFYVGFTSPGQRSVLGDFLLINKKTFERGILSGVLSSGWELYNVDENDAKIKYSGTGKIGEKKCHSLSYNPKKGSDLSIKMFFDPDTFRHVRTEYRRTISSRQGTSVDSSSSQSETRYTMTEDFSEFKVENNLMLPHEYKIGLEILSGNGSTSREWSMTLSTFVFNVDIDDKDFRVDSY